MKLKRYNHLVTVSYDSENCNFQSSFCITAIPVTKEQAQRVAEILFPKWNNVKVVSVKNIANDT